MMKQSNEKWNDDHSAMFFAPGFVLLIGFQKIPGFSWSREKLFMYLILKVERRLVIGINLLLLTSINNNKLLIRRENRTWNDRKTADRSRKFSRASQIKSAMPSNWTPWDMSKIYRRNRWVTSHKNGLSLSLCVSSLFFSIKPYQNLFESTCSPINRPQIIQ